jgi:CRISPR/Cas system CSM-associated protein Csm4 (group 5 of RAMP superfamily)
MRYLIAALSLLFFISTFVEGFSLYHQQPFDNIQAQQQQLEDELYYAVNSLLEPKDPDDAKKNCDSCISILKLAKRFCYFPESIQLAAMTSICKRSKQVDNQVVNTYYTTVEKKKAYSINACFANIV